MVKMSLAWPLGMLQPLAQSPMPIGGAAIRFLTPSPGRVLEINGVEILRGSADIQVELKIRVDDQIKEIQRSEDRVGYVLTRGDDAQSAATLCEKLKEQISIVVK